MMPGVGKVVGAMNAPKAERVAAVIKNGQQYGRAPIHKRGAAVETPQN